MRRLIWKLREAWWVWRFTHGGPTCGDGWFFGYPKRPFGPVPSDLRMRVRRLVHR
jgi:hypothetical protein